MSHILVRKVHTLIQRFDTVVQEGRETPTSCDFFSIHMAVGRLLKHQWKKWYDRNTQMQWQRKDAAIASRFEGATFSLTGKDDVECIEGVETFK